MPGDLSNNCKVSMVIRSLPYAAMSVWCSRQCRSHPSVQSKEMRARQGLSREVTAENTLSRQCLSAVTAVAGSVVSSLTGQNRNTHSETSVGTIPYYVYIKQTDLIKWRMYDTPICMPFWRVIKTHYRFLACLETPFGLH